jgi:hypothetical protein
MQYDDDELFLSKLCMYREDAIGGIVGMTAVCWSILNRAKRHKYSIYESITTPWAYSSMVAPGYSNEPAGVLENPANELKRLRTKVNNCNSLMRSLSSYPRKDHPAEMTAWNNAAVILKSVYAEDGTSIDPTKGSTLYYAKTMEPPPKWALATDKTEFMIEIGGQRYYKEF